MVEERRKLMDAWSACCEPKTSATIVQLRNFGQNSQLDQRMQRLDRGLATPDRNKQIHRMR